MPFMLSNPTSAGKEGKKNSDGRMAAAILFSRIRISRDPDYDLGRGPDCHLDLVRHRLDLVHHRVHVRVRRHRHHGVREGVLRSLLVFRGRACG